MPQIIIPDRETLSLGRNGSIGTLEVDWDKMPQEVLDHIWRVYSAQFFTDAANAGGRQASQSERLALAQKKLAAAYAGELRARRGENLPADPLEAEEYRLAKIELEAILTAKGAFKDIPKGTKDRLLFVINREAAKRGKSEVSLNEAIDAFLSGHPAGQKVKKQAKENLEARQAPESDIADLLGF